MSIQTYPIYPLNYQPIYFFPTSPISPILTFSSPSFWEGNFPPLNLTYFNIHARVEKNSVILCVFLSKTGHFPAFCSFFRLFLSFFDFFSPLSTHRCCCLQFGLLLFSPVLRTCETLYVPHCGLRQQQLPEAKNRTKRASTHNKNREIIKKFYLFPHKHLQISSPLNCTIFRPKCASPSNYREAFFHPPWKNVSLYHRY